MQEVHPSDLSTNKKRSHTKPHERQAYLDDWKKSGLTMREFCRQHDLSLSSFSGWAKQSKTPERVFKSLATSSSVTHHVEIGVIEITFKNSVKIRFLTSPSLAIVLQVATELARCS